MKSKPGALPGRRAPALGGLGALFAFSLLALVLTACGISLGAGQDDTETFKRLTVDGDFRVGGSLLLALEYAQQYPVAVDVACDLLEVNPEKTATPEGTPGPTDTPTPVVIPRAKPTPANKVLDILVETLPANSGGGPVGEATPVSGVIERAFAAPERPGRYVVMCFTPNDDNNAIFKSVTIAPASTPIP